jgi:amino acid transporter
MSWEKRRIGPWSAAALVTGNMIGAGVFTTSGFALADLGDPRWVLLAWALGGGVALCGALSYGGLARRIPRSGGEYTFLAEAMHPALGCAAGWISLLAGFTAPIAAAALVLDRYLVSVLGGALPEGFWGVAAVLGAGLAHGIRVGSGAWLQNAVVALKLALLAALIVWGGFAIADRGILLHAKRALDMGAFGVTLVWISFAYSGWNGAVYLAGELRDPDRNLSRCLWLPAAGVAVIYLALNAVFLYAAPIEELAGRADIGAVAAKSLGGDTLQRGVVLIVCLALLTSISAMVMAGPRVYAQMALDGYLPRFFARGRDAPAGAIALQVGCALAVMGLAELIELLGYLGFTLSLSAALTVGAAMRLRHREGAERVPIPLYPWVPGVFIAFTLAAAGFLVWRAPLQAAFGLATAGLGVPLYWWRQRRNEYLPRR